MKKSKYFCTIIGGIILAILIFYENSANKIQEFNLIEYEKEIEQFKSERVIDKIENSKDAIKEAEKVWNEIYGDKIKELKPYEVLYDTKNQVWLVKGTIKENYIGGVPYILVQANGKVLAIWHDK